jgi:hypothetical protein
MIGTFFSPLRYLSMAAFFASAFHFDCLFVFHFPTENTIFSGIFISLLLGLYLRKEIHVDAFSISPGDNEKKSSHHD